MQEPFNYRIDCVICENRIAYIAKDMVAVAKAAQRDGWTQSIFGKACPECSEAIKEHANVEPRESIELQEKR